MNRYEAMFLMDANTASEWTAAEAELRRLLDRASAKVLGLKRWDERKLCYEISRRKRGVYALVYFEAPAEKIAGLEHDAQLSEMILRLLVLRHERLTPEAIEKALTAAPPPRAPERTGDIWSSRGPGRGDRDRDRDRGRGRDREGEAPRGGAEPAQVGAGAGDEALNDQATSAGVDAER